MSETQDKARSASLLTKLQAMEADAKRYPIAPDVEHGDYTVSISARELGAIFRRLNRLEIRLKVLEG